VEVVVVVDPPVCAVVVPLVEAVVAACTVIVGWVRVVLIIAVVRIVGDSVG